MSRRRRTIPLRTPRRLSFSIVICSAATGAERQRPFSANAAGRSGAWRRRRPRRLRTEDFSCRRRHVRRGRDQLIARELVDVTELLLELIGNGTQDGLQVDCGGQHMVVWGCRHLGHRRYRHDELRLGLTRLDEFPEIAEISEDLVERIILEAIYGRIITACDSARCRRIDRFRLAANPGLRQAECENENIGGNRRRGARGKVFFPVRQNLLWTVEALRFNTRALGIEKTSVFLPDRIRRLDSPCTSCINCIS